MANGWLSGTLTIHNTVFQNFYNEFLIDTGFNSKITVLSDLTANASPLTTVTFTRNEVKDSTGMVVFRSGATTQSSIGAAHVLWNKFAGYKAKPGTFQTGDFNPWAAVSFINVKEVKVVSNQFLNIPAYGANGNGMGVMAWSQTSPWTLNVRFNTFTSNNGGVFVMTGVHSSLTSLKTRTYYPPVEALSAIEYNVFQSNTLFAVAMCDLGEDYGPLLKADENG